MKLFAPDPDPKDVPPQFKWAADRMAISTWLVITVLSVIGVGIWNGGAKLTDLVYAVTNVKLNDAKQDEINERQDSEINKLELTLAKQQGYLERILDAVESNGRRMRP